MNLSLSYKNLIMFSSLIFWIFSFNSLIRGSPLTALVVRNIGPSPTNSLDDILAQVTNYKSRILWIRRVCIIKHYWKYVNQLSESLAKDKIRAPSNNTRCPKKKWDLLLVTVAVNPTFFWDTLLYCLSVHPYVIKTFHQPYKISESHQWSSTVSSIDFLINQFSHQSTFS